MKPLHISASTPYQLGYLLGQTVRTEALALIDHSLQTLPGVLPVLGDLMLSDSWRAFFSAELEEAAGMADAIGLPFETYFHFLCAEEIRSRPAGRCTTIYQKNGAGYLAMHLEEWHQSVSPWVFPVVKTLPGRQVFEIYYAGTLGGLAMSANDAGLCVMINTLFFTYEQKNSAAVPNWLFARWLINHTSISTALEFVAAHAFRSSFCFNLLQADDAIMLEVSPQGFKAIPAQTGVCHTNHTIADLPGVHQGNLPSLARRQAGLQLAEELHSYSDFRTYLVENPLGAGEKIHPVNRDVVAATLIDSHSGKIEYCLARDSIWETYP